MNNTQARARSLAAWLVRRAMHLGRLVRQPCEVCSNPKVIAHHNDYTQPLQVRWLCRTCHGQWHYVRVTDGLGFRLKSNS